MSDDRVIKIAELNKRIDELINGYESELQAVIDEGRQWENKVSFSDKIDALQELKIELNNPEPATDLTETVQQSLNLIEAKNIITSPTGDQNTDT